MDLQYIVRGSRILEVELPDDMSLFSEAPKNS